MPVVSPPPAIYRSAPMTEPLLQMARGLRPSAVRANEDRLGDDRIGAAPWRTPVAYYETGEASWYGQTDHRTASGEPYNPRAFTAAHRWLPLNTRIKVTDLRNGRSVTVRINDRGPYVRGRILDLSVGAARALHMLRAGVAPVRIEVLGRRKLGHKKPPPVAQRGFNASAMAWVNQTE